MQIPTRTHTTSHSFYLLCSFCLREHLLSFHPVTSEFKCLSCKGLPLFMGGIAKCGGEVAKLEVRKIELSIFFVPEFWVSVMVSFANVNKPSKLVKIVVKKFNIIIFKCAVYESESLFFTMFIKRLSHTGKIRINTFQFLVEFLLLFYTCIGICDGFFK